MATYTFDVFTSLDGNSSYGPPGDWGGYWGKQGPEFLDHRFATYEGEQRMVFGATTFGMFVEMLPAFGDDRDPWLDRMLALPTTNSAAGGCCRARVGHHRWVWAMRTQLERIVHRNLCRTPLGRRLLWRWCVPKPRRWTPMSRVS